MKTALIFISFFLASFLYGETLVVTLTRPGGVPLMQKNEPHSGAGVRAYMGCFGGNNRFTSNQAHPEAEIQVGVVEKAKNTLTLQDIQDMNLTTNNNLRLVMSFPGAFLFDSGVRGNPETDDDDIPLLLSNMNLAPHHFLQIRNKYYEIIRMTFGYDNNAPCQSFCNQNSGLCGLDGDNFPDDFPSFLAQSGPMRLYLAGASPAVSQADDFEQNFLLSWQETLEQVLFNRESLEQKCQNSKVEHSFDALAVEACKNVSDYVERGRCRVEGACLAACGIHPNLGTGNVGTCLSHCQTRFLEETKKILDSSDVPGVSGSNDNQAYVVLAARKMTRDCTDQVEIKGLNPSQYVANCDRGVFEIHGVGNVDIAQALRIQSREDLSKFSVTARQNSTANIDLPSCDGTNPRTTYYGCEGAFGNPAKPQEMNSSLDFVGGSLIVQVGLPGISGERLRSPGFCGGYFSPLMLFFEEGHPRYDNRSTFLKEGSRMTAWPEANHVGYFLAVRPHEGEYKGQKVIHSPDQLFGTNTFEVNGFEILKHYDSNEDLIIDSKDDIFKDLLLWKDKNGDGIATADEIYTLEQKEVIQISLDYDKSYGYDIPGRAIHRGLSNFTFKKNGELINGQVTDVYFADVE